MDGRGRKRNLTLEEELDGLKREAAECEDKIKQLTARKKELKQTIDTKQMEALYQAVIKSEKSIDEVISWINGESQEEGKDGL